MPLTDSERAEVAALIAEAERRTSCPFRTYFPDKGPLRRELYPKSLQFFEAGKYHRERLFLAANRTSKTVSAAYEITAHVTGEYPHWWPGRRFEGSTTWWVAGDTFESTRDVIQNELCGPREMVRAGRYAGMIPANLIVDRQMKSGGVPDCVGTIWIKHVERHHGAHMVSTIETKAYQQGRLSFQGTTKTGGIWLDEEPPDVGTTETASGGGTPSGNGDIYTECLLRTATTNGLIIATFTPLRGLTPFLSEYLATSEMAGVDEHGKPIVINSKLGMFGQESAA